ncbi:MAG: tetratricopeptide repeat protein [Acidobacteria bacterium]|nr:tetratricopeptide repeat protein [Acidobacteriota bacterium]MBV9477343.1 tetratricopeptide repeat protein [Acidobacteriota bacterium]
MRKTFLVTLSLLCAYATHAFAATEARLSGAIVDAATKQPIPDATITLDAMEVKKVHQSSKAKKDGSYAIFVLDGTIRYKFTVAAPGYATFTDEGKLKLGETTKRDFELVKAGDAVPASTAAATPPKNEPGVTEYNEGAALANAGDIAGATEKFKAAVAAKPELYPAWSALAKMQLRQSHYADAIAAANKVLEIDDTDAEMLSVLVQAYTATGDKAKAAEAQKKLPANASSLFNDAAHFINSNNDAAAEPLLKQAIGIDPNFAQAYFELGMIYARASKNAEAKQNLETYLKLAPDGKDAASAKEMLGYLK